jgi:hypothetical protein
MMTAATIDSLEAPRQRISWVELSCLNCGELAGYVENHRIVKPVQPGLIKIHGNRLRCGRCSGLLLFGDRGIATSASSIG